MATDGTKEHMDKGKGAEKSSGETHSGNPNPNDPNKSGSTEHKSSYGGDGGKPRTTPDTEQGED